MSDFNKLTLDDFEVSNLNNTGVSIDDITDINTSNNSNKIILCKETNILTFNTIKSTKDKHYEIIKGSKQILHHNKNNNSIIEYVPNDFNIKNFKVELLYETNLIISFLNFDMYNKKLMSMEKHCVSDIKVFVNDNNTLLQKNVKLHNISIDNNIQIDLSITKDKTYIIEFQVIYPIHI